MGSSDEEVIVMAAIALAVSQEKPTKKSKRKL